MTVCCCVHEMTLLEAQVEWEYRRTERLSFIAGSRVLATFDEMDQAEAEIPEILREKIRYRKK